jgi:enoyl-CoA hydratase/carnithine racemase
MSKGTILLQEDGAIARVTLSNPQRYNAMSYSMWRQLADIVARLDANPAIRVILLRGEGSKAFASGADISEFGELRNNPDTVRLYDEAVHAAQSALIACAKPVVARIEGVCMGGGIGLAISCDLRYASKSARFRMPAARLGLGYGFEGMRRLVDFLGPGRAAEIFYTAETFDGNEAARIGMVERALDDADLDAAVERTVAAIAANAPLTVKAAKRAIRDILRDPQDRDLEAVQADVQACFDSADYVEGRNAFAEKRMPRFTGS